LDNIFEIPDNSSGEEIFEDILKKDNLEWFRLERIISFGNRSPEEGWYDQQWNEWVMVVKGEAVLEFETGASTELITGDHIFIEKNVKHKVSYTSDDCVWLALHFKERSN